MKIYSRESYNDIIELLLEDAKEINEKTKKELALARKEISKGNFYTEEEAKNILKL